MSNNFFQLLDAASLPSMNSSWESFSQDHSCRGALLSKWRCYVSNVGILHRENCVSTESSYHLDHTLQLSPLVTGYHDHSDPVSHAPLSLLLAPLSPSISKRDLTMLEEAFQWSHNDLKVCNALNAEQHLMHFNIPACWLMSIQGVDDNLLNSCLTLAIVNSTAHLADDEARNH